MGNTLVNTGKQGELKKERIESVHDPYEGKIMLGVVETFESGNLHNLGQEKRGEQNYLLDF